MDNGRTLDLDRIPFGIDDVLVDHVLRALEIVDADDAAKVVGTPKSPVETGFFILEHLPGDLRLVIDPEGHLGEVGARGVFVKERRIPVGDRVVCCHNDLIAQNVIDEGGHLLEFPALERLGMQLAVGDGLAEMLHGVEVPEVIALALLSGFAEELFFRGLLQPALAGWTGAWTGLILTSALFGAARGFAPSRPRGLAVVPPGGHHICNKETPPGRV